MSDRKPLIPIPPALSSFVGRVKEAVDALSKPKRILLVTTVATAVLIGGWFSTRSVFESYAVLFSSLEHEDSAAIVASLKEMKVPYRLANDGTTIEVPESRVHEARLQLAAAHLPRGGGVGFESFDKMRLGATDFEQKVLYRRALEGELSRTIGQMGSVQSARVHLVMPDKSVFVSRTEPASASIVVKMKPGHQFKPQEVGSVVHMVAASVPGLSAEKVALVTAEGVMLHRPKSGAEGDKSDEETPAARLMEANLEERVRAMLEKVVGPGHADVRATVEIDVAKVERTEDHFDPTKTVVRSEEVSAEKQATVVPMAGVPGAESNLPGGTGGGKPAEGGNTIRESHTRNFEVDRITEKRTTTGGVLRRLTVAVILDGKTGEGARSPQEVEKIAALVKSAVGADDKRGDVVTVHALAFAEEPLAAAAPAEHVNPTLAKVQKYGPYAAAAVFVLFVAIATLRARKKKGPQTSAPRMLDVVVGATGALPAGEGTGLAALAAANREPEDVRTEALGRAERDPATAALILKEWLKTDPVPVPNVAVEPA